MFSLRKKNLHRIGIQKLSQLKAVKAYFSIGTTNQDIADHQRMIQKVLDSERIQYEVVDVASCGDYEKQKMRDVVGNVKALPPQIANDETYCGDFDMFEAAAQKNELEEFLKMKP